MRFRAPHAERPGIRSAPRALVAVTAVAGAIAISGCGADFNARTNEPYQPAHGLADRSGQVYLLDTLVVTDEDGNGTVVSRLVNQQDVDDQLTDFSAVDSTGKEITTEPLAEPVELGIPPHEDQSVQVGYDGLLRMSGDNVVAGDVVTLTFTFEHAEPITMDAPVMQVGTLYGEIPVGPPADAADG